MIRAYKPEDKAKLIELIKLNTPQYFDVKEEQDLSDYLDNEIEDYFVEEEGEKVIGCGGINYEDNGKTAIISWDIIHPDFQGKGLGRKLLLYRINRIKEIEFIAKIVVRTSQHTDKFYNKGGFKLEFIKKNYWAKGFDLYQMSIKISKQNAQK